MLNLIAVATLESPTERLARQILCCGLVRPTNAESVDGNEMPIKQASESCWVAPGQLNQFRIIEVDHEAITHITRLLPTGERRFAENLTKGLAAGATPWLQYTSRPPYAFDNRGECYTLFMSVLTDLLTTENDMGILARGRLGLLAIVIAILGLLAAPAVADDSTACAGDYNVTAQALLLNPNAGFTPNEATVALATPIPAGDYTLAMVSYDEHSTKPVDQSDQLNEQWFLQLLDAQAGVVYQSGVSPDLPDAQDWLTFNTTATVTGEAVSMRVVHAAIGDNVNSIIAHCAAFTAVPAALGSIGNTVWFDTNGNGWMDGAETGLEGVRVFLSGPGVEGTLETLTDAAGHYMFTDLPAGSYDVTVDVTTAPVNSDLTTPGVFAVALAEGQNYLDADFGFAAGAVLASAGIGDQVWMDSNLNGIFDSGEAVLAGVTLSLYDTVAGTTETTVTGASGQYLFAALTAGSYEVSVITSTAPESTALTTAGMFAITLSDGQMSLIADFGFAQALPATGFETADFGIAGLVLLLIGAAVLVLVRPADKTPWHLANANEVL